MKVILLFLGALFFLLLTILLGYFWIVTGLGGRKDLALQYGLYMAGSFWCCMGFVNRLERE
jgi:hypothetical protein